jgi:chemotaxis protein histidine kinase CheA
VGFGKYLKAAFVHHWNLLAFLGSAAFVSILGPIDFLLPLVLAGEITYVGLLAANPKFQKYVDAHEAKQNRLLGSEQTQQALQSITRSLSKPLLDRFESLRAQCVELRQIALALKHPGKTPAEMPLDELQLTGLDRLLWIHLRLLFTQMSLSRFLQKTNQAGIEADITRLEKRLHELPAADPTAIQGQRVRKALEDNLETSRTRLANLSKAQDNYELVKLEIDRLENKIRSLSEMAINRQEPEFITGQVDEVAHSMVETERTMNELKFATGLDALDDEPPQLLRGKVLQGG